MTSRSKVCNQCGQLRPLSAYYRHKKTSDGYLHQCKQCVRSRVRSNTLKRKGDKTWRAARTAIDRRWRSANHAKVAAHRAVRQALRSGKLRQEPCAECIAEKTQAHHDDYSKPLSVVWLCASCHAARHARKREAA